MTEEPLEIRVASSHAPATRAWTTMRTPGHDFELAVGWAVNEGVLAPEDLVRVAYCTDDHLSPWEEFNVVTITSAASGVIPSQLPAVAPGSSACGVCGREVVSLALDGAGRRWGGPTPTPDVVRLLPDLLRTRQGVFKRTGASHAAALADAQGELLVVREDVGRHNAVDKVVGARVLAGEQPGAAVLVVSGRAGFELVQKALASGTGALVSVGAPTNLAVDLAAAGGLALWGFTSASRTVRYA